MCLNEKLCIAQAKKIKTVKHISRKKLIVKMKILLNSLDGHLEINLYP